MTTSAQLKREIEVLSKALTLDTTNKRFSTWGEFNEGYLTLLSEAELKQYWRLVYKFALITDDITKTGRAVTLHTWTPEYAADLEQRVKAIIERGHLTP